MKIVATIFRYLVGGLFIFSGMIKVNDPVGTAIKMEEYFEIFSLDFASFFHVFVPIALPISVFLVVIEVVLGFALLINYKPKWTINALLVIVVFFTLLTGFSAITNSVTDCGCFGDAIKLTPWESFSKDIALLVMIVFLYFSPAVSWKINDKIGHLLVAGSLLFSLGIALYAIAHLPFIDFRAYKIGNHIPTEMQPSADYIYEYVMEKDGKQYSLDSYPADKSYKFIAMNHLNPEAAPTITDFAVWNDEGDYTEEMFQGTKLFIILYNVSKTETSYINEINALIKALGNKVQVYVLTASARNTYLQFSQQNQLDVPFYYTDATVLKTIVRSNPGIWMLKQGTVVGKWHANDIPNYSQILELSK